MPEADFDTAAMVLDDLIDALNYQRECGVKHVQVDPVIWRDFILPTPPPASASRIAGAGAASDAASTTAAPSGLTPVPPAYYVSPSASRSTDTPAQRQAKMDLFNQRVREQLVERFNNEVAMTLPGAGQCFNPDLFIITGKNFEADEQAGVIFSGEVGALFDNMIAAIGYDRQRVYLTAGYKGVAPGLTKREDVLAVSAELLREEIRLVNPRVLLLMGPLATKALFYTQRAGLCNTLGRWHMYEGTLRAMAIHNPMRLFAAGDTARALKVETWKALKTVREFLAHG